MSLDTHAMFQPEILIRSTISAIHQFQENILESSHNIVETTPGILLTNQICVAHMKFGQS